MQKNISSKNVRLLILTAFIITSSFIMYGCNDSPNEPESPSNADSINTMDTINKRTDTLSSDTTKGGQPVPPG
jgi:starvation-inducible outer membrane lipoprotein